MIYLDTSCLIKLLRDEPRSDAVRKRVHLEESVMISALAELETEVQLKAAFEGGEITSGQLRRFQAKLSAMRHLDPFHFRPLPSGVFGAALAQNRRPGAAYCRTLDRLHLGAMEELKLKRLMTLDKKQAAAAFHLGFAVVSPV